MAMTDEHPRIYLESALLKAQLDLKEGLHPEDVMLALSDKLETWIEAFLGNNQPQYLKAKLMDERFR